MSRRSRKQKQRFSCGHLGFGQYCHRCADAKARREAESLARQIKRSTWQETFAADPIDLRHLPKGIVKKARQILTRLSLGMNLFRLGGKYFNFDRSLIRVPIGYRYRLLCRQDKTGIHPLKVLSHEDYNAIARNKKQA